MTYLRWAGQSLALILLLPPAGLLAPFLSLRTGDGWPSWGGWFWTWDNPPQGDRGFLTKRAPFPNAVTGWRGWVNRTAWLWRNPLYGLKRRLAVPLLGDTELPIITGDSYISDRYGPPGRRRATIWRDGGIDAFELYIVRPYKLFPNRCLRVRVGWKIGGDSFLEDGFAPLVCVINPFKSYGESIK